MNLAACFITTGGERDGKEEIRRGLRPRWHGRQRLELYRQPAHTGKLYRQKEVAESWEGLIIFP